MDDIFDSTKQQQLINQLKEICQELGWIMVLPVAEDDTQPAPGLILGTEDFVEIVMDVLDGAGEDNYEAFSTQGDEVVERPELSSKQKKRSTFH